MSDVPCFNSSAHFADNMPLLYLHLPLQAVLRRETVIRALYRSEILWLVYCCQSRALGRRLLAPELQVRERPGCLGWTLADCASCGRGQSLAVHPALYTALHALNSVAKLQRN